MWPHERGSIPSTRAGSGRSAPSALAVRHHGADSKLSLWRTALAGQTIGISNFNASMIDALFADGALRVKPAVNQCGFSIGGHNKSAFGRDFATLANARRRASPTAHTRPWAVSRASMSSTTRG